jgi:hypothetical protein
VESRAPLPRAAQHLLHELVWLRERPQYGVRPQADGDGWQRIGRALALRETLAQLVARGLAESFPRRRKGRPVPASSCPASSCPASSCP